VALMAVAGGALLFGVPQARAQAVGRLFTTVEKRIELDAIRDEYEYGKPPKRQAAGRQSKGGRGKRPSVPEVTVNGVVLRSSGIDASWVNGTPILDGQATEDGIRVEPRRSAGGSVQLILPSGVNTRPVRPGQKIDVVNGRVIDTYTAAREKPAGKRFFSGMPSLGDGEGKIRAGGQSEDASVPGSGPGAANGVKDAKVPSS